MDPSRPKTLHYRRSHFVTQLPVDYLYSSSHAWIARRDAEHWRVGLTKFATRMLGEMVDHGFDTEPGAAINTGQILGWVEGFKAISDLFSIAEGRFAGGNPALKKNVALISQAPYGAGWLYELKGQPEPGCIDVHAYRDILDRTIDKILEKQARDPSS